MLSEFMAGWIKILNACTIYEKYERIASDNKLKRLKRFDKELYKEYGSEGFPSWTIPDSSKRVLQNSNAPIPGVVDRRSNIGYPYGTDEIKYYLYALKTTAPTIKKSECDILSERLKFYRENQ